MSCTQSFIPIQFGYLAFVFSFSQPRYLHPTYKEITTRVQMTRGQRSAAHAGADMRLLMPAMESRVAPEGDGGGGGGPKAGDYLAALRAARLNNAAAVDAEGKSVSVGAAPTLAERIESRRAALDNNRDRGQTQGSAGTKNNNNNEVDVQSVRNILKDQASKAEFVKKMSKTFGYGMPSNAEPKTDTLSAEAEKCALLLKSSKSRQKTNSGHNNQEKKSKSQHKTRPSAEARKAAKQASSASREREVQPWDFGSQQHSSVAPINPLIDIEIDPELDHLLAELEQDEDFAQLNENEQKTWLESLFFQDTLHCPGRMLNPRDRLQAAKSGSKATLRLNRDGNAGPAVAHPDAPAVEEKPVTTIHVNDQMKQLAQGFFSSQPSKEKPASKTTTASVTASSSESAKQPSSSVSGATMIQQRRHSVALSDSLSSSPNVSIPSPSLSRKSSIASFATPPTSRKSSAEPVGGRRRSSILLDTEQEKAAVVRPCSIKDSLDEISGVNKNLCSLAQSYFSQQQPKPPVSRKISLDSEPPAALARQPSLRKVGGRADQPGGGDGDQLPVQPLSLALKAEDNKASLVAAFFGGARPAPTAKVSFHHLMRDSGSL